MKVHRKLCCKLSVLENRNFLVTGTSVKVIQSNIDHHGSSSSSNMATLAYNACL